MKYRWVIIALFGMTILLNGLISHAIIPIQWKMTLIYKVSYQQVSISIIITFICFFIANFPINKVIQKKGLRYSLCTGSLLYFISSGSYLLINVHYYFTILGGIFTGIGQPFLINSSVKVANIWFFPKNRNLVTALLVGTNFLGLSLGFIIPTQVISQQISDEAGKQRLKYLYLSYFIFSALCLVLNMSFMQSKPQISPSSVKFSNSSSFSIFFRQIMYDDNFMIFLMAYCINLGSLITFVTHNNFILKPYGFTDTQIAFNVIILMIVGISGSIIISFYLKKTSNYHKLIIILPLSTFFMLVLLIIQTHLLNNLYITTIIIAFLGLSGIPLVPMCYQLGCQLGFPLSDSMITGLLNGGAFLWAFITSSFISLVFGFDSKDSTKIIMITISFLIFLSFLLFYFVKIKLKRSQFERQQTVKQDIEFQQTKNRKYSEFIQDNQTSQEEKEES